MRLIKKLLLILLVVLVGIQFIPTKRNQNQQISESDISKTFTLPAEIQTIFKNSCYDCHSNNTNYPWYNKIKPVSWLLENHIKKGKKELNFSEFGSYSKRKQKNKLKSIKNQVIDDEMPMFTYTLIHKKAKLTESDKKLIKNWAVRLMDSIK
ncbi:heme-binding domain-containing protein [Lutibacter sp.]|uniref:heme-binding domain-containing protein n=1 Tax=Lutibacter sp. TaxID=1925666 RepID=UPI0025C3B234|nr:heme-binding domain-containing protein [Lutibacter sp.]MCF6181184.1 heme-binding domain-containing protein [Lutibacter sp.]